MKYYVTKKSEIGSQGPGIYVWEKKPKVRKVITVTDQTKMVEQSQAKMTDVHELLEPAIKAGLLRHATKFEGEMDDIPVADYQEAMNVVAQANSMFEQLPGKVREKFENNPANFLQFVQNPVNGEELQKMGLLKGNDGKLRDGITPSGAPSPGDLDGDGIQDPPPPVEPENQPT